MKTYEVNRWKFYSYVHDQIYNIVKEIYNTEQLIIDSRPVEITDLFIINVVFHKNKNKNYSFGNKTNGYDSYFEVNIKTNKNRKYISSVVFFHRDRFSKEITNNSHFYCSNYPRIFRLIYPNKRNCAQIFEYKSAYSLPHTETTTILDGDKLFADEELVLLTLRSDHPRNLTIARYIEGL